MTLTVFAGISLRHADGIHFGTLVRIRTGMAGVQTDALYAVGDRIEFQLELTGFDAMVQGLAEVVRADPHDDDLSNYLLRIRKMRRADQDLLQEWYDQQQAGQQPSLRGDDQQRVLDSQVESQLASAVGAGLPTPPTPAGGKGRAAIRELLLDAASARSTGTTGGAAADEPGVALDSSCHPPRLLVSYRTQASWREHGEAQLLRGLLFVPLDADEQPPIDASLQVHIQRPALPPIDCTARVALQHERGVGLSLDLEPAAVLDG